MVATKKKTVTKNRIASSNGNASNQDDVAINPINDKTVVLTIEGTSPYVQNKFSEKAKQAMIESMMDGSTGTKNRKKREKRDFEQNYKNAMYVPNGKPWKHGAIPATAIKAAMVSACRLVDFTMTAAKQCVWVEPDGFDKYERIPLIKITEGDPFYFDQAVRNANGNADIRARPMWDPGWQAEVRITYDADRFTAQDVVNLLHRAGQQVGIGEGRNSSVKCVGLGWGAFRVVPSV